MAIILERRECVAFVGASGTSQRIQGFSRYLVVYFLRRKKRAVGTREVAGGPLQLLLEEVLAQDDADVRGPDDQPPRVPPGHGVFRVAKGVYCGRMF